MPTGGGTLLHSQPCPAASAAALGTCATLSTSTRYLTGQSKWQPLRSSGAERGRGTPVQPLRTARAGSVRLFVGLINLARYYKAPGGPAVSAGDDWIAGKSVAYVEVESAELAAWSASGSHTLRFVGYVIVALSVL
jgi:hypothetical protein